MLTKTTNLTMKIKKILKEIVKKIISVSDAEKIILFGSWANGTPGPDSDIDLIVIKNDMESQIDEYVKIRNALDGYKYAFDIIPIKIKEFEQRAKKHINSIFCEASENGIVLYEKNPGNSNSQGTSNPDNLEEEYKILLQKAISDLLLVKKLKNDKQIEKDILLFHLQQAAEKFIKSLISFNGLKFPHIHDLKILVKFCEEKNITLPDFIMDITALTPYAVEFRYDVPMKDIDVAEFYKLVNKLKNYVKKQLK